ncbi:PQQ-binding-like beta-propeller repeat protein [Actinocrinis puniceicyclus]|uniref:PQQ-binding-like beta-propeller repeat protein n=1 Tax=Actinocrinis puniceicyclus TaxID=977794 RepID=A0A8J7WMW5_9ACTN|nr:PQQ-binding-like beta-propeller repeat protein [Actinocrinis puniceicyclus]MBS2964263.1 PQQ-binding-like beta-propeller repeat protein [Actinocrinis puniceicyclus]
MIAASGIFVAYAALAGGGAAATTASATVHAAAAATVPLGQVTAGDWPTYHLNNTRDGNQTKLNPVSTLSVDWSAPLDGAVYGEPLLVGGRVLAATENDTIYALNRSTGAVLWSAHVGSPEPLASLPCGDISPLGITSTMVYDPGTNRVFAVAETTGGVHTLFGLNAGTGAIEVQTEIEPPLGDAITYQQRGALTLLNGRIYIPYGGLFGDCGNYIGQVLSVATDGTGMQSFAVPTTREGGIWETGGGVVDGANLLYASGNGQATSGSYDGSDSVIELSPTLQRLDYFAPTDWATQNGGDADLGSMTPALVGQYIYVDGKTNNGYVLRNGALGGVGGQVAELANTCQTFGTAAVSGNTVYLPCATGPQAVTIGADGTPTLLWKSTVPAEGSPVLGGGAVWAVDYFGGELYALDPATGATKAQIYLGSTAPNFVTPTVVGDQAFVGTVHGVVAVGGA